MDKPKVRYVSAEFGFSTLKFQLPAIRVSGIFGLEAKIGSLFGILQMLAAGHWKHDHVVLIISAAHPLNVGVIANSPFKRAEDEVNDLGSGHYVGLAAMIIEAFLYGIELEAAYWRPTKAAAAALASTDVLDD